MASQTENIGPRLSGGFSVGGIMGRLGNVERGAHVPDMFPPAGTSPTRGITTPSPASAGRCKMRDAQPGINGDVGTGHGLDEV